MDYYKFQIYKQIKIQLEIRIPHYRYFQTYIMNPLHNRNNKINYKKKYNNFKVQINKISPNEIIVKKEQKHTFLINKFNNHIHHINL